MRHKTTVREKNKEAIIEACKHYWVIESAHGPESRGICKYCGETRDFSNSLPDFSNVKNNKRRNNLLELPKIPDVDMDQESLS